nr:hypothetical protein [Methanobrevibacter arboriphilus]
MIFHFPSNTDPTEATGFVKFSNSPSSSMNFAEDSESLAIKSTSLGDWHSYVDMKKSFIFTYFLY